jgi:hypothetical protein
MHVCMRPCTPATEPRTQGEGEGGVIDDMMEEVETVGRDWMLAAAAFLLQLAAEN